MWGPLLSNGMKTLRCYAMLCYANLGWESAGRSICFTQYKEGTFTMEMLTYIPIQWIVVVPLTDFSECHSTSESSQTGPKVPSRPVQWLAANTSGQ